MTCSSQNGLNEHFYCLKTINREGAGIVAGKVSCGVFATYAGTSRSSAVCNQILIADRWYEGQDILFVTAAQRQHHREVTPSQINIL